MGRIFGGRDAWVRISNRFRLIQSRPFCTHNKPTNPNNSSDKVNGSLSQSDAYKALNNLDFMTAARILFTTPPKKKKFGIDFHLVQLFFACMPSLAVYLVAQYARHEMRRMEAEMELKKKAEEEAKAKEMELKAAEEKEAGSDSEILEVKERLNKLEEAVKEIVIESKKESGSTVTKNQEDGSENKQPATTGSSNTQKRSEASNSAAEGHHSKQTIEGRTTGSDQQDRSGSTPVTDAS